MDDYIQALRSKDETPGSMLAMTEDAESAILDKYRSEVERKVSEKERQRLAEKQRKEQRSQEREKLREEKLRLEAKKLDIIVKEKEKDEQIIKKLTKEQEEDIAIRPSPTALPTVDDAAVQRAVEEVVAAVAHQEVEPKNMHAMNHDLGHGEAVSIFFLFLTRYDCNLI